MIRVTLRTIDDVDGALLGDFPPSEIPGLLQLLKTTRIYFGDDYEDAELVDNGQFSLSYPPKGAPRVVLDLCVEQPEP